MVENTNIYVCFQRYIPHDTVYITFTPDTSLTGLYNISIAVQLLGQLKSIWEIDLTENWANYITMDIYKTSKQEQSPSTMLNLRTNWRLEHGGCCNIGYSGLLLGLQSNAVSHWLGANLESALIFVTKSSWTQTSFLQSAHFVCWIILENCTEQCCCRAVCKPFKRFDNEMDVMY